MAPGLFPRRTWNRCSRPGENNCLFMTSVVVSIQQLAASELCTLLTFGPLTYLDSTLKKAPESHLPVE